MTTKASCTALFTCIVAIASCGDFGFADPDGGGGIGSGTTPRPDDRGSSTSSSSSGGSSSGSAPATAATRIATDAPGPASIAILDGTLYVANENSGTIKKVDADGGALLNVVASSPDAAGIAASPNGIYWVRSASSGRLFRLQPGSSSPSTLSSSLAYPRHVLVASQYVFVAVETAVMRFGTTGGAMVQIASGQAQPTRPATDGSRLYWANEESGDVFSATFTGSDQRVLTNGLSSPSAIVVEGSFVYIAERSQGRIAKIVKSASSDEADYLEIAEDGITSLGVMDETLYYTTGDGIVGRISTTGANAAKLASGQDQPSSIQVTEDAIYWVNTGSGEIMRLRR